MPAFRTVLFSLVVTLLATCHLQAGDKVSFRHEVMGVVSKAGCNLGTCHGNANGKGGFRLSLRGEDPAGDFLVLSHQDLGRRANLTDPDASLLLLKPTMQVPHVGGKRFAPGSNEYRILRDWIARGMRPDPADQPRLIRLTATPARATVPSPESSVQISVTATFSDGETRDVTSMAVYEPSEPVVEITQGGRVSPLTRETLTEVTVAVRYLHLQQPVNLVFLPPTGDFVWEPPSVAGDRTGEQSFEPSEVDRFAFAKLKRLQLNPSDICDDATFIRRASLDLNGLIPTAEEARAFVESDEPGKRAGLIDELLQRQEFADWWTLKWADLLRNEQKVLDRKGVAGFQAWIRSSIGGGMPMNEFARKILSSRGSSYSSPASNYYRAMRDPVMRAESAAQVFLGVRLQCAKCHNHPFDRWTQDDYYGWANLFARVDYKILENDRRDRNDKHEFNGEQIVYQKPAGGVEDPRTGKAVDPRLLVGMMEQPDTRSATRSHQSPAVGEATLSHPRGPSTSAAEIDEDPLAALADWVSDSDNRQFARVQVNRLWADLFGRGLVEPVDDFRVTNPATHPELLEWLTEDFIQHNYDLRHTLRVICNSQVYQLSARPTSSNQFDDRNLSHTRPRRLSAEQLLDSLSRGLGVPLQFNEYPVGLRASQLPGSYDVYPRYGDPSAASEFLLLFGKPPRLQACSCERSAETTLAQSFQLISGRLLHELISAGENRLAGMSKVSGPDSQLIEELYWNLLTRSPTAEERQTLERTLGESENRRRTLEDIAWALVNSAEFLLRR